MQPGGESDTALGDWYVNRIVVDRKPLLLLVSAKSLLPIVIRAKEVRMLPDRLPDLVAGRLKRLGVPSHLRKAEEAAMHPVKVGMTADRSVVGILVEQARLAPDYVGPGLLDETTLHFVESRLEGTPWFAGKRRDSVVFATDKTRELLRSRWGGG